MVVGVDATVLRNRRGYGRFARNVLPALVAADPGTSYVLYVDRASASLVDVPGARLRVVDLALPPAVAAAEASNRSARDLLRFARAVHRDAPDAMLFTSLQTYVPVRAVPLVVGIHDVIARERPGLVFPGRRQRVLWNLKERDAVRRARQLFTVSEAARRSIASALRLDPAGLAVVPEAPDPLFTPVDDGDPVLPVPPADPGFILCAAGGISPHKNVETLLEAFALLEPAGLRLVVVGALGDETYTSSAPAVRARADALGVADRVVFPGFVSDEVLGALYRRALVVVNPSLAEGFGLTAVEAAACGAPVVLGDLPAHRETLDGAAVFFDPRDAPALAARLRELIADPALRAAVARRCLAAVAGRTWGAAGAALAEVVHGATGYRP